MNKSKKNVVTKLKEGGRIVIPAAYRKALEIKPGDKLVMSPKEDGSIRIIPIKVAIRNAQALVRRYAPEGQSLNEELMLERRAEAAARE